MAVFGGSSRVDAVITSHPVDIPQEERGVFFIRRLMPDHRHSDAGGNPETPVSSFKSGHHGHHDRIRDRLGMTIQESANILIMASS